MLLGATIAASAFLSSQAVFVVAFGTEPLGLPVVVVSLAEIVPAVPSFWLLPHLMRILMDAVRRGGSLSRTGTLAAILGADGSLARSRGVVLAGLVWVVIFVGGWSAFTASRES